MDHTVRSNVDVEWAITEEDVIRHCGDRPPPRTNLVEVLQHWATVRPDRVAFYFTDGDDPSADISITFAELDEAARNVAGYLQKYGKVTSGARVLLLYPPVLDFVIGFFGCLYAGAVAVPAFPPRRNRKGQRIHGIAHDCQAQVALTNSHVRQQIEGDVNWVEWESISIIATDVLRGREYAAQWQPPKLNEGDLAVLQYTSGSTGQPKGVMLSHANLVRNCELIMVAFEPDPSSVGVSWLPTYHDMGLVGGILEPVFVGCPMALMSPMAFLQKPIRWLRTISRFGASISGAPNFAYQLCVDKVTDEELSGIRLDTWRTAFNGAEPVRAATLREFTSRFAAVGFDHHAFLPCYGMAETTLIVTGGPQGEPPVIRSFDAAELDQRHVVCLHDDDDRVSAEHRGQGAVRELVGSGQVLPGETVLIVDPETLQECASDRIGEIWIQSPSVGQGYWQREEATEATFQAYTADGRGPFLRSGDLGFMVDGELFVAGRLKDMIIVRGVNRYPQDIEQTAESAHEALQSGQIAAFADHGEDRDRLVITAEVQRAADVDWQEVINRYPSRGFGPARNHARFGGARTIRHPAAHLQRQDSAARLP
ncbi:MAG: hypothetical protein KatS3mg111_1122 [Pirellulaceae bacterium]|nr:MAG: hypothetical protein KatS3mg111_1122 [Pirellulaceae bacterium]